MYKHLVTFILLPGFALADLTCHDYIPKNSTTNRGQIQFLGNPWSATPANASVGNPWKLASKTAPGATFEFKTCHSKSLNVSASKKAGCEENPCYTDSCCSITYTDFLQIINPYTGHCLTIQNWNASVSDVVFMPCGTNNQNTSQLWAAFQTVDYGTNFKTVLEYETPVLDVTQIGDQNNPQPPYLSVVISKADNKTIQVNQTMNPDAGFVSMLLV